MSSRKKREKRKRYLIRRQKRLESIRLRRKNKVYLREGLKPNSPKPTKRIRRTEAGSSTLTVPKNFELNGSLVSTLKFLNTFRNSLLRKRTRNITIDHREMGVVDPPSALMLIAEIMRGKHCSPKSKLRCFLPTNDLVAEMLQKLDYWTIFGLERVHRSQTNEQFVMRLTDRRTIPQSAKDIIVGFADCYRFSPQQQKVLYKGLVECMDNVMGHAYPSDNRRQQLWLNRQWWMLAYKNLADKEVRLCFYDQGVGIPNTIRTRFRDRINPLRSDEDIIVDAVIEGNYSKTKEKTRGRGLPKLLEIIEGSEFFGELSIYSQRSHCRFFSSEHFFKNRLEEPLDGTLITWRLTANHENQANQIY